MWGYGFHFEAPFPQYQVSFYGIQSGTISSFGIGGEHTFTIPVIQGQSLSLYFTNNFSNWYIGGGASASTTTMRFDLTLLDDQSGTQIASCYITGGVLSNNVTSSVMNVGVMNANRNCRLKIDITIYLQPS